MKWWLISLTMVTSFAAGEVLRLNGIVAVNQNAIHGLQLAVEQLQRAEIARNDAELCRRRAALDAVIRYGADVERRR